MMDRDEFVLHWNSFCNLAAELEETQRYVYHGLKKNGENLIHAGVYSDIFRQIIIGACSEFETMCKILCKEVGYKVKNILDISECILSQYPQIIQTKVYTQFWCSKPLESWKISKDGGKQKVSGIDWWKAYSSIKHDEIEAFKKANLGNAVAALAAVYIIDLYILKRSSGNLHLIEEFPPRYFRCEYTAHYLCTSEGELPDFGNKTTAEVLYEKYDELYN